MSANSQMMAQMLAQQLGGQQQQPGVQASPLGGASQLAQKIMLMQALQKGMPPQQPGQPPVPPQIPGAMQPQQMNQMPQPGGVNA
jgi:hypothetical protein